MVSEELMIGDWVCYSKVNKYYTRVNEIRHTEVPLDDQWYIEGMRSDNDKINPNAVEYFAVEILSPIPLTPEILEKNGFEIFLDFKDLVYYESDDKRIKATNSEGMTNTFNAWSIHVDTEDMRTMAYGEITYVHEFQHLLRLCRIEKTIEI